MNTSRPNTATDDTPRHNTQNPRSHDKNATRETIAVEGGEAGTPNPLAPLPPEAEDRAYDLLHQAIRTIPQRHRIGWYQALARRYATPLTNRPTTDELAYLAWSAQRHTNPRTRTQTQP